MDGHGVGAISCTKGRGSVRCFMCMCGSGLASASVSPRSPARGACAKAICRQTKWLSACAWFGTDLVCAIMQSLTVDSSLADAVRRDSLSLAEVCLVAGAWTLVGRCVDREDSGLPVSTATHTRHELRVRRVQRRSPTPAPALTVHWS